MIQKNSCKAYMHVSIQFAMNKDSVKTVGLYIHKPRQW